MPIPDNRMPTVSFEGSEAKQAVKAIYDKTLADIDAGAVVWIADNHFQQATETGLRDERIILVHNPPPAAPTI